MTVSLWAQYLLSEMVQKVWVANLHGARSPGGAAADVEQSCASRLALASFTGRPAEEEHHGFLLEQADEVGRLLALSHTDLATHNKKTYSYFFLMFSLHEYYW